MSDSAKKKWSDHWFYLENHLYLRTQGKKVFSIAWNSIKTIFKNQSNKIVLKIKTEKCQCRDEFEIKLIKLVNNLQAINHRWKAVRGKNQIISFYLASLQKTVALWSLDAEREPSVHTAANGYSLFQSV